MASKNSDTRVREYFDNISILKARDRNMALEEAYAARNYLNVRAATDENNESLAELLKIINELEGKVPPSALGVAQSVLRQPWMWIAPSLLLALIAVCIPQNWDSVQVAGRNGMHEFVPGIRFVACYAIVVAIYLVSITSWGEYIFQPRRLGMRPPSDFERKLWVNLVRFVSLVGTYWLCGYMIYRVM